MLASVRGVIRLVHSLTWALLIGAFVLLNVFAFKVMRVPVDHEYSANFANARWIGVAQNPGSVGYFRKTISLDGAPSDAYLLMQGSQSYSVYINGNFLDKTRELFLGGRPDLTNIYDLGALLQQGQNTIAFCAQNYDLGRPQVRALMGLSYGEQQQTFATDSTWRSTSDPLLVKQACGLFGRTARSSGAPVWTAPNFADDRWPGSVYTAGVRATKLAVNPVVYQTRFPTLWALAGASDDAFYHATVNLTSGGEAWLRLASSGLADTYINGHQVIETPTRIGTDRANPTPRAASTTAGVFDITPLLRVGSNDIAVHVTTLSSRSKSNDPKRRPAAVVADLLVGSGSGNLTQIVPAWQASSQFVPGWTTGNGTDGWASPVGTATGVFSPHPVYRVVATSLEKLDAVLTITPIAITSLLFLLGCALAVLAQIYLPLPRERARIGEAAVARAIDRVGIAMSGTVALGVLLLGLKLEPLIPRPFPYTAAWLAALALLPWLMFALTYLPRAPRFRMRIDVSQLRTALPRWLPQGWSWLPYGIGLVALIAIGAYMVTYQLGYESFWQDELSSIYAAVGVLQTGVPHLASGFIYPKGELFSYVLAVFVAVFGQDSIGPRILTVSEYLVSLPLTFFIGRYFFGKRVGLLATALVVFSPFALLWARQARMYQQAELAVLIMLYLFYRACQPGARPRAIYLSMAAVLVMYLSHEESFIVLPAIAIYFFATKRLTWITNIHWWTAGLAASAVILGQLLLTVVTHPPALGNDMTQRPMIAWTPENFDFYMPLLLDGGRVMAHAFQFGWTTPLAIVACIAAAFVRDPRLRYISVFFAVPLVVLIFGFSLNSDRYLYPLFPSVVFLASLVVVRTIEAISRAAGRLQLAPVARGVSVAGFAAIAIVAIVQSQTTPLTYFGLATSRMLGLDYHHRYPDYQAAGTYIRDHWHAGDTLITVAPSIEGIYYAEQPDYMIYQGKALYLYEKNNHIVDTLSGSVAILSGRDLAAVLSTRHRVWLMSTSYYRATLPKGFLPVFEGQQSLVYLRSGANTATQADNVPFVPITPGA